MSSDTKRLLPHSTCTCKATCGTFERNAVHQLISTAITHCLLTVSLSGGAVATKLSSHFFGRLHRMFDREMGFLLQVQGKSTVSSRTDSPDGPDGLNFRHELLIIKIMY